MGRKQNAPYKGGNPAAGSVGGVTMSRIMWQYCQNLNDINKAIEERDPEWEGLISAKQIISVSFDKRQGAYLVVWMNVD